jgi:hypothetical protein
MFYNDHFPPHFHAEYGEQEALIDINTLAVIAGKLPPRALGLVMEWTSLTRMKSYLNGKRRGIWGHWTK